MSRLALIDGDVVVYAAGFASDAAAKKELLDKLGGDKEEYAAHVEEHGKPFEPLAYALKGTNQMLDSIPNKVDADDSVIYLSHPVNYRESFYPEYKLNRNTAHKPHWYDEIKEHLLNRHAATYSQIGDEADDAMGMAQMDSLRQGRETIICTVDKDLDMIPGLHYNWSKTKRDNGVYTMEDPEGLRLFYTQMLTGDTSDNIPGMYAKLGMKAAARWLIPIEGMDTEREMYEYVLDVYKGDEEFVHLNAKLLWIKRDNNWWAEPAKAKRKVTYG